MNASWRWAFHFAAGLECVRCRAKRPLKLYRFDGTLLQSEKYTLEEIQSLVPTIDAWCDECDIIVTSRVRSEGRLKTKQEAARMATIRAGAQIPSRYDTYLSSGGVFLTKQEFVKAVESDGCQVCDRPAAIYPSVGGILWSSASLLQLEEAVKNCWLLCPEHVRTIEEGGEFPPKCIELDENFWARYGG